MCVKVCCRLQSETCSKLTMSSICVLGDAKFNMLEDSWSFSIMVSFWIVLWKTKWDFQRPRLNFYTTNVCFAKWAGEYKTRHGVIISKLQWK